jgi:diguanylate cyclase (GGDEF)-like protein
MNVHEKYNSLLSFPLISKEKVIGTVNLFGDFSNSIKDYQVEFISVVAEQVAIAVSNAKKFQQVQELAITDKLTGAFNRRYFMELLEKAIAEKLSVEKPVSLVLMDIDNFGKYNNTYGHPKGDVLLKELSEIIMKNLRESDSVGRYGGEEFIILMPNTKQYDAFEIAKKIKEEIKEHPFFGRETQPNGRVTISAGLAVCMDNIAVNDLLKETDDALYKAKHSGKDRIVQRIILKSNLRTEI